MSKLPEEGGITHGSRTPAREKRVLLHRTELPRSGLEEAQAALVRNGSHGARQQARRREAARGEAPELRPAEGAQARRARAGHALRRLHDRVARHRKEQHRRHDLQRLCGARAQAHRPVVPRARHHPRRAAGAAHPVVLSLPAGAGLRQLRPPGARQHPPGAQARGDDGSDPLQPDGQDPAAEEQRLRGEVLQRPAAGGAVRGHQDPQARSAVSDGRVLRDAPRRGAGAQVGRHRL